MIKFISFQIILIITTGLVFSQSPANADERAFLITDKNLYITGESLHFSSGLYTKGQGSAAQSKVIYIELITPSGEQISAMKVLAETGHCSGTLEIPSTISSGYYYLRAYSKYMRNLEPDFFAYSSIKIVNPFKRDVLDNNGKHKSISPVSIQVKEEQKTPFKITLDRDKYRTREKVQVNINTPSFFRDSILYSSVSIVPEHSVYMYDPEFPYKNESDSLSNSFSPENNGLTISGVVKDKKDHDFSDNGVNLTLLGEKKNVFYPVAVDERGKFVFTLPELYSSHDMFISIEGNSEDTKVLIDNDFDSRSTGLPSPAFILSEGEEQTAIDAVRNLQVKKHFLKEQEKPVAIKEAELFSDTIPFYGKPDQSIYIKDFIDLPFLSDYFLELNVPVRIKKEKKETSISIISEDPTINLYPALVMVDYVPVYDMQTVLKINPEKVLRFDIINSPYQRGKFIYGGILNVISRNNDFAGIKLPETGLFLNYQFLNTCADTNITSSPAAKDLPDTRNTLYWNSDPDLFEKGVENFSFHTADTKDTYLVRVSAVTKSGKIIESYKKFEVE